MLLRFDFFFVVLKNSFCEELLAMSKMSEEQQGRKVHDFIEIVESLVGPFLWPDDSSERLQECFERYVMEKLHSK